MVQALEQSRRQWRQHAELHPPRSHRHGALLPCFTPRATITTTTTTTTTTSTTTVTTTTTITITTINTTTTTTTGTTIAATTVATTTNTTISPNNDQFGVLLMCSRIGEVSRAFQNGCHELLADLGYKRKFPSSPNINTVMVIVS